MQNDRENNLYAAYGWPSVEEKAELDRLAEVAEQERLAELARV